MALTFRGNNNAINQRFLEAQQQLIDNSVRILKYCGEMAVNEARAAGNYIDVTGNLRSSVGFVITIDGKVLENGFDGTITRRKRDGTADMRFKTSRSEWSDGKKTGHDLALSIARQTPGLALIVVAGMKYASQVESRGVNVLTSAEQVAKTMVPNLLKQLK